MIILERIMSYVILVDKNGDTWLARRKKLRHDSRRRKGNKACRVIYIPINKLL